MLTLFRNRLSYFQSVCWAGVRGFSVQPEPSYFDTLAKLEQNVVVDSSHPCGLTVLAFNFSRRKNALSEVFVDDLSTAVKLLENDQKSKVTVVCSLVPDVFCAGADLRERAEVPDAEVPKLIRGLRSLFQRIYCLPMPTVAAIDGAALGGGLELALACDVRYAGSLPRSILGLIETHWALLPGAGGSQRLPRLIGEAKAKELILAARRLSAVEAAQYGVISEAIEPDSVPPEWKGKPGLYRALEYAMELCSKGPIALRQAKRAINEGMAAGAIANGLAIEGECYTVLVPTKDRKEGMAAFMQKRKPVYHGL